ncbi:hypothetical protein D030_2259B, partial [Vibrio parahaemolyticus AQ3810]
QPLFVCIAHRAIT